LNEICPIEKCILAIHAWPLLIGPFFPSFLLAAAPSYNNKNRFLSSRDLYHYNHRLRQFYVRSFMWLFSEQAKALFWKRKKDGSSSGK